MEHYKVYFEPDKKTVHIHSGATLLEAANRAGIILNAVCGGKGTCGKCKVKLADTGKNVLACKETVDRDMTVEIPKASRFFEQQILQHGIDRQIKLAPSIRKHYIELEDVNVESIRQALGDICTECVCQLESDAAEKASEIVSAGLGDGLTAVSHRLSGKTDPQTGKQLYRVMNFEPGDTRGKIFGVAVDIGTTTVVAKLVDMTSGQVINTQAISNPQSKFGADVIARISHGSTEQGLGELHDTIIKCLNDLIAKLCQAASVESCHIYEVAVAGNTTMNHAFLKYPLEQLGHIPFKAHSTDAHDLNADQLGIEINSAGNVHTIANIAGFLGADTTAVAVAVGMDLIDKMTLIVDIGTNGELILGTKDKMYGASCAAGPAFEGAMISQGSRAVKGAIQAVVLNESDIEIDVIGGVKAESICGSGLIDVMAVLVELNLIDTTGRFAEPDTLKGKIPDAVIARIVEKNSEPAFLLAGDAANPENAVFFTQKDVRETQLAKAAMRVGIVLLQKKMGIKDEQIEQILLAGAFGNYVRRESAKRIGLLPDLPLEKVQFVGNAAGTGAQMVLLSSECRDLASSLSRRIEFVELANEPDFSMAYAECMMF